MSYAKCEFSVSLFLRLSADSLQLVARQAGMDFVHRNSEEQGMYPHHLQIRDTWCARCCKCRQAGTGGVDCTCGARRAASRVDDVCAVQWNHPELRTDLYSSPDSVGSVRSLQFLIETNSGAGASQGQDATQVDSVFARAAVYAKSNLRSCK